ncbi:gp19.2 [Erwinia phage vB_EamP-L1]|uniref:Gp19.2 n=1 Tax=Erwinia phage vB_EamP-L1 TaxID=1051673 RepID=G0YQ90_9CAUD|nr:gp19.2 [Erwinia phage vB_EamP-L1]AEJ81517.1 gp19.2 [Erwinia phage vB_EamP-L1]
MQDNQLTPFDSMRMTYVSVSLSMVKLVTPCSSC